MIVRIATDRQYRLPDENADQLNQLDNAAVKAVEAGNEGQFHELFEEMLDFVRRNGQELEEDDLEGSDVILPPPDMSFAEAGNEFTGEGLIPD